MYGYPGPQILGARGGVGGVHHHLITGVDAFFFVGLFLVIWGNMVVVGKFVYGYGLMGRFGVIRDFFVFRG
ncbi:hypothetical protein, partial [Stenotrophomonas maltophilia]|uniref:hypothetical protein n=1 Tax=Stenotrophomonas maltophilia TaxID=40324 RepID=UPI0034572800